ncbi:9048_t:CDS:2 [Entrophospora sp. SA101]|nr:18094_t:CDS:2 [Entrophospora sp. SA101]CAJ0758790.1 9048_t:CDS:2 [Entrophospora sp. SA101]
MDELFVVEAYKWRIRGLSTMTLTDSVSVEQTTKSDPTEVFDIDSQDSYRGDGECEKPYWDDAIDEYIRCSNNDTFKTTCSKYKLICTIDQENHYAAQRKNFVRFALYRVEDSKPYMPHIFLCLIKSIYLLNIPIGIAAQILETKPFTLN